jgi:NitT/TauT family transport system permease protein
VFATMLVISVIVLGAEWLISKLEHRLLSWRPPSPSEANTL